MLRKYLGLGPTVLNGIRVGMCGACWYPICWLILIFKQVFGPSSSDHSHLHVNGITLQKSVSKNATSELDEGGYVGGLI